MRSRFIGLLVSFLASLPLGLLGFLGRQLGRLLYIINGRERKTAEINIQLCFPEQTAQKQQKLVKSSLIENAITLLELPASWGRPASYWLPKIDCNTVVQDLKELAQSGPLIIAMPHIGNWELAAHFLTAIAPTTALYRPPREPVLESFMTQGRSQNGIQMAATDRAGIRALYQALGNKELVVILPDQQPKMRGDATGLFAPFFSVPAYTMTLLCRLARKTGARVAFLSVVRGGAMGYQADWFLAEEAVSDPDIALAVRAMNRAVEQTVRACPEQYQWSYRRFSARPDGMSPVY